MYKTSAPSSSHTFLTQYRTVADGLIIGALCVLLEGCVTPVTQVRDGQATAPAVNPEAGIFPADPALAMPDPGSEASAAAVGGSPTDSPPDGNPPGDPLGDPPGGPLPVAPEVHPGLLSHVARRLELNHETGRRQVQAELRWYQRNPDYLQRVAKRGAPHLPYILQQIEQHGLPAELALLPVIESAYDPFAYSHGRAAGLWQFVPGTARLYGLRINWWQDERRDVKRATDAALKHLADLARAYDGSWLLALAAYNSGPGTVNRALRRARAKPSDEVFWSLKLPAETRAYIPRLLALSHYLGLVHKSLPVIQAESPWVEATFDSQLDLAVAEELSGVPVARLYELNAGLNRWATPPSPPHRLLLPSAAAESFSERLAEVPKAERIAWRRHVIRDGETLGRLAARFETTVDAIQAANRLRGTVIRAGDALMIPVARSASTVHRFTSEGRAEARNERLQKSLGNPVATHVVNTGDTWWDLARKYGVGTRELARWNGLGTRDLLRPGQTLNVYGKRADPVLPMLPLRPQEKRRLSYRVREGESLWLIANRFNVTVANIRNWNDDAAGKYIQPGDRLTLYVDVTQGFAE